MTSELKEQWQPIETAPKDGTPLLLGWDDVNHSPSVGCWRDDSYAKKPRPYWDCDRSRFWGVSHMRGNQPTHWMPLPAPPAEANP